MQKFFTAAFFVAFLGLNASAQQPGLLLKSDSLNGQADISFAFFEISNYIINNTGDTVTMRWTRTLQQPFPFGWYTNFCDYNLCYLSQISTADFTFDQGDTSLLKPVFYTVETPGTGIFRVKLESLSPGVNYLHNIVYIATATEASGAVEVQQARDVALFPNPAGDVLHAVFVDPDFRGSLRVTDAMGRVVLTQPNAAANEDLQIGGLPAGFYVLQAWTEDGHLLLNKGFSKQ